MGALRELLGLFGILALSLLLATYVLERWLGRTWPGFHRPFTLKQLTREWLLYMLLFAGLGTLLERMLTFACSVSC